MVAFFWPRVREVHVECIDGVILDGIAQKVEHVTAEHGGIALSDDSALFHAFVRKGGPREIPFTAHDKVIRVLFGVVRHEVALAASDFHFDMSVFVREHVFPSEVKLVRQSVWSLDGLAVAIGAEHVMPQSLHLRVLAQVAVKFRNHDFLRSLLFFVQDFVVVFFCHNFVLCF